jgi:hypothetical protein
MAIEVLSRATERSLMQQSLKVAFLAALALILTAPAFADTYNAVTDYTGANPNGVWTYAYIDATGFHVATVHLTNQIFEFTVPGVDGWTDNNPASPYLNNDYYTPVVAINLGAPVIAGSHDLRTDMLILHPGPTGQEAVVQWTAPKTDYYDITSVFEGLNTAGTTTDVHVLANGVDIYTGYVNGYQALDGFGTTGAYLQAGDTLTFAVGGEGTFGLDTTGLQATIVTSAIPEPVSGVLLGTLLLVSGAVLRFRRR